MEVLYTSQPFLRGVRMNDLTPAQQVAYTTLLPFLQGEDSAHLAVLEGYAGTGKTYLVAALLGALTGLRIAVAAPTNKAVRVLRDKLVEAGVVVPEAGDDPDAWLNRGKRPPIGCTCRSIQSLLGMKLKELDNGQHEMTQERDSSLRDYQIVVIDECSMLNDALFQKIVMERGQARVLFVGDPAQLPPVNGAGEVSPVFERVALKVRLTEVVRQAADNPIIRLSIRLRQLIEAGVKASALELLEVLPPMADGPKAALVAGPAQTLIDWWLGQYRDDAESDTRIIAYTNDRVQYYNRMLHHALYGETATRFVVGERVIVHTQFEAERLSIGVADLWETTRLITSDELQVLESDSQNHPFYPDIPANRVVLLGEDGETYRTWIALDEGALQRQITACFVEFRALKAAAERASDPHESESLKQRSKDASNRGWALKKTFASLRHAYAITCHKSQGSTFDCALVDFSDLAKMQDAFSFNRALYVAVTRSREFLALVVT